MSTAWSWRRSSGPAPRGCGPAISPTASEDGPATFFYLDPPYLPRTRTARKAYGPYEMTEADHRELLDVLLRVKGKVGSSNE